ncbi:MAG TPA: hypothetical protein VGC04_04335 [Cellulomonas sp.]
MFAISWELVSAGGRGIIDPRGYRAVYQATWWMSPVLLVGAGVVGVVTASPWTGTVVAVLSILLALACFRFPFPRGQRRSISDPTPVRRVTDSNWRRRLPLLLVSGALAVTAPLIGPVL